MASAGNNNHYEVVKPDGTKAQYVRVTHVIQETLAKQALVGWAYKHTRDTIAGMVAVLIDAGVPWVDILDTLNDADMLEEYLKENQLRPDDVKEEAGELGTENHVAFERLGRLALDYGDDHALAAAMDYAEMATGHAQAIGRWWSQTRPRVIASELEVTSHRHEYKGTVDLLWHREGDFDFTITDLKNRGADKPCAVKHKTEAAAEACHSTGGPYDSDYVQVGAYSIAWHEQNGLTREHEGRMIGRRTVLIAQADGRYRERESELDSSIFLDLLSIYRKLRGGA